jgi:hypothetical protein
MLLNVVQQQLKKMAAQANEIRDLKQRQLAAGAEQMRVEHEVAELRALNQATQLALRQLQSKAEFVATR